MVRLDSIYEVDLSDLIETIQFAEGDEASDYR